MAVTEIIYIGSYHNSIDLLLKSNDAAIDLNSVTEITANIGGVDIVSTNQSADLIRWDQIGYQTGEIRCRLGGVVGLTRGSREMWLIVKDPTNANGVVFGPVNLTVIDLP